MNSVYFINAEYIWAKGGIDSNVDEQLFKSYIEVAQTVYIRNLLGKDLYDKCQDLVYDKVENGVALTGIYRELIEDYLVDTHYWYFMSIIPTYLNNKFTNQNVAKRSTETSQASDDTEVASIRREMKMWADRYSQILYEWLCENEESIPEFTSNNNKNDAPISNRSYNGIYLGPWKNKRDFI